jgi:hypothetical protein
MKRLGLRTSEQLINAADNVDDDERTRLLTQPRPTKETLIVDGMTVVLRDQEPLLRRRDVGSLMGDGLSVSDWVRILNRRVYLFTDRAAMDKVLNKYIELDGAQEVITFSPRQLFDLYRPRIELSAQNAGAIARTSGTQKRVETFLPVARFPDKRPAEVTVVDGIDDLSVVVFVERHQSGGERTLLAR